MAETVTGTTEAAASAVTRAWYSANARRYDRLHPGLPGDAAFYAALARGRRVLEIGAGTGRITATLAAVARRVVAVDSARPMLAQASERLGRLEVAFPVALLCADARALPLSCRFDLIVAAYRTVQHLHTPAERLAFFRIGAGHLVPGGQLAFDTWHGPLHRGHAGRAPILAPITEEQIQSELRAAGLSVCSVAGGFQAEPADAAAFTRVWSAVAAHPEQCL